MAGEFKDYERGPGFWFLWALVIASDISKHPYLKAALNDEIPGQGEEDLYTVIDNGLTVYESIHKYQRHREW